MRGSIFTIAALGGALTGAVLAGPSQAQDAALRDKLFSDPTNIDINLAYLQSQLAIGNFKGAAATLQRVLLLDPNSRLAKTLYAEVQMRLGNLSDARLILAELLADPEVPPAMRDKAQTLKDKLDASARRFSFSGSIGLAAGSADNALAAPKGPQVQYFNALYDNSAQDVAEAFGDYDVGLSLGYKLPSYVERNLSGSVGIAGRDYQDMDSVDSNTGYVALNFSEKRRFPWNAGFSVTVTEVDGERYNIGQQVSLGVRRNSATGGALVGTLRAGETRHFTYGGSAAGKMRDKTTISGGVTYTQPLAELAVPLLLSVNLAVEDSAAELAHYDTLSLTGGVTGRMRLGGMGLALGVDFVATEFGAADPLIGDTIREDERSRLVASLDYQLPESRGGATLTLSGFAADTRSNIVNFTKTLSEIKLGVRHRF